MKKFVVLLVALGLLFCLCGCSGLEQMRKQQAFMGDNGEIIWNGSVYQKLPHNDAIYIDTSYDDVVYLTQKDVPVLLSVFAMEQMLFSGKDGILLEAEAGTYYCREDQYERALQLMTENFTPEFVCFCYYTEEGTEYYTLTQEQVQTLELVAESVEPTVLSDGMYLESEQFIDLQAFSEDMLLWRDYGGISVSGKTYYLYWYNGEKDLLFTVPAEYSSVFAKIVEDCIAKQNEAVQ